MKNSRLNVRKPIMLGAAIALATLSPLAVAQNYSVTINPTLNGLDIKFDPVANPEMLIVKVTNNSDKKARCDFLYEAQPQFPYRTAAFVDAGKETQSVFQASTHWFSVNVNVTCVAV